MVLSSLAGMMLTVLVVWALLIIIGRLRNPKYSNLYAHLKKVKGVGERDRFERFWKSRDSLERPGASTRFTIEEAYLYYYRYAMNYLSIAFICIIFLAIVYYFPLAVVSYFDISHIPTTLLVSRKFVQILLIALTFFGFFAYHRCHYQVEMMYKEVPQ